MKLSTLIARFRSKRSKPSEELQEVEISFSDTVHSMIINRALRRKAQHLKLTDPEMVEFIEQVIYGLQKPLDFKMPKNARIQVAEEILFKISKKKIV